MYYYYYYCCFIVVVVVIIIAIIIIITLTILHHFIVFFFVWWRLTGLSWSSSGSTIHRPNPRLRSYQRFWKQWLYQSAVWERNNNRRRRRSSWCSVSGKEYSYFEKGCRKKCKRQSRKALWVVLSSLFFEEIWKNWYERPWKCVCEC